MRDKKRTPPCVAIDTERIGRAAGRFGCEAASVAMLRLRRRGPRGISGRGTRPYAELVRASRTGRRCRIEAKRRGLFGEAGEWNWSAGIGDNQSSVSAGHLSWMIKWRYAFHLLDPLLVNPSPQSAWTPRPADTVDDGA